MLAHFWDCPGGKMAEIACILLFSGLFWVVGCSETRGNGVFRDRPTH